MRIIISIFLIVGTSVIVSAQSIPFDSDRWDIKANEKKLEKYLGRDALYLKGGQAIIRDSDFKDGTIEFDIAFSGARGFMGGAWRWQDAGNYEEFYMRPHQSGLPDANQYQPVFNGVAGWQLYHGAEYGTPVKYDFDKWMPVRIAVSGGKAEIYVKNLNEPMLFVSELKRENSAGKVGLIAGNFAPAYFSNFRFTPAKSQRLFGKSKKAKPTALGTVERWSFAGPFEEAVVDGKLKLSDDVVNNLGWSTSPIEAGGFVNIARNTGIKDGKNTVFVRLTITSETDQVKKFRFGYSDRARVYFNRNLIYSGTNQYQSRDYRYLGSIGLFDEVYLPLKKGSNELWIAVSESFGGWGVTGLFEDMSGIKVL